MRTLYKVIVGVILLLIFYQIIWELYFAKEEIDQTVFTKNIFNCTLKIESDEECEETNTAVKQFILFKQNNRSVIDLEKRKIAAEHSLAELNKKLKKFQAAAALRPNICTGLELGTKNHTNSTNYIDSEASVLMPVYNNSKSSMECEMDSCFNFSMCSISKQFSFYLYPLEINSKTSKELKNSSIQLLLHKTLSNNRYKNIKNDLLDSCIYILLIDQCDINEIIKLPNWYGNGKNHLVWFTCEINQNQVEVKNSSLLEYFGEAMLVFQNVHSKEIRYNFDIIVSHWQTLTEKSWQVLPPISPARRKYLASYIGNQTSSQIQPDLLHLDKMSPKTFYFQFNCYENNSFQTEENQRLGTTPTFSSTEHSNLTLPLCQNIEKRGKILNQSTFSLIFISSNDNPNIISTSEMQLQLCECLKAGAIPIILGLKVGLPFHEVIDWTQFSIVIPLARLIDLHVYLKHFSDSDILALKRNGRRIFERYMSSTENVVNSVLGLLRTRLGLPSMPYEDIQLPSLFANLSKPLTFKINKTAEIQTFEPSPNFTRKYMVNLLERYSSWNTYSQPFQLFPFTPWSLVMPSESQFMGSSDNFQSLGSGHPFNKSLGGNIAKEQFTVVILTYQREKLLMSTIGQFFGCPFLNKVIVVWNSPENPSSTLKWPEIGVPIQVVRPNRNSLNNRFLPLDIIETEAILSLDDDTGLQHEDISFAFRVWRENRDQLVGFPVRMHTWDTKNHRWKYDGGGCQYSLVLTGAAFFHKFYSYMYTFEMSELIREKVDEYKNCEDIAMNFLISHVTRKPPIKVTFRHALPCPGIGCGSGLSNQKLHYEERAQCLNYFSKIYGYTPLVYTQYRADSVYYGSRNACFKSV